MGNKQTMERKEKVTDSTVQVHPLTGQPTKLWTQLKVKQKHSKVTPLPHDTPKQPGHTRFVCISDTHSQTHRMAPLPQGDVLIHAGDFTQRGTPSEVKAFNDWLGTLPFEHKIVIAGNHELTFEPSTASNLQGYSDEELKDIHLKLTNCTFIEDEAINVLGFKIYGSPWQPEFCDWAYNLPRGQPLLDVWNKIPDDTDILVTHGPPLGYGDATFDGQSTGCAELLFTIQKRVKPKYHICGHIHEGYGITTDGFTTYINASTCTLRYKPTNPPIIFDLPTPSIQPTDTDLV